MTAGDGKSLTGDGLVAGQKRIFIEKRHFGDAMIIYNWVDFKLTAVRLTFYLRFLYVLTK